MVNRATKEYFISALKRAFHTFWEVFASMLVIGIGFSDVDWMNVISVSGLAAVLSLAKSFAVGIPEEAVDGELIVTPKDDSVDVFTLHVNDDVSELAGKARISFKVGKDAKDVLADTNEE